MRPFTYSRPGDLAELRRLLAAAGDDARLLAGGQTLIATMKQGLAAPEALISLAGIDELTGIRVEQEALVIGAMTSHADIARSEAVCGRIPALTSLANGIGDPAVREKGTIGGSIANNDPAADWPAALLALEAVVTTDRREWSASDFFTGMFETALAPGEVIVSIRFPVPRRGAYAKFPNPASRYAVVGVFVAENANGTPRVAVTGAGPVVFRWVEAEARLADQGFRPDALDGLSHPGDGLNDDIHASADYRAHLIGVMTRRALARLAAANEAAE